VLFADEAEMLACAARDVCRGPLSLFWWWRYLLHETSFERVVAAWRDAPAYMPAAFELLTTIDAAASWIRRLTPSSAAALLDALLRAHALPALADEIAAACREVEATEAGRRAMPVPRPETAAPSAHRPGLRPSDLASPWRGVVPAEWEAPSLPLVPRTFAAMCIVLRRSPWLPRTDEFSRAIVSYLREARRPERRDRQMVEGVVHREDVRLPLHAAPFDPRWSEGAASPESSRHASDIARRTVTTGQIGDVAQASEPDDVLLFPTAKRRRSTSRHERAVELTVDHNSALPSPVTPLPPQSDASSAPETASTALQPAIASIEVIESDYAGAFFLINVALDLELYSHGVTVIKDLHLGIWRFVELAARDLLVEHDADDSLWELLKSLAEPAHGQTLPDGAPDLSPDERARLIGRVHRHLEALFDVEDSGSFLIRRRGRITRTPGHLDVSFPLERHPIEIRAARLDRNPGWIPAAGVHVGFHFD
jgi:hypothetical protein